MRARNSSIRFYFSRLSPALTLFSHYQRHDAVIASSIHSSTSTIMSSASSLPDRRSVSRDYFGATCPGLPTLPPRRFILSNRPRRTNAAHRTKTVIPDCTCRCRKSKVQQRRQLSRCPRDSGLMSCTVCVSANDASDARTRACT